MKLIGIMLLGIYFFWGIYRRFRPKKKSYEDYIKHGIDCETYFRYKKAMDVYEEAMRLPHLTPNQKATLKLNCGNCLLKLKRYAEAVPFFDEAFEDIKALGAFHYTGQLKRVLKGYIRAGEQEKAKALYENLIKRTTYDSRFSKLKRLGSLVYSDYQN